MVEPCHIGLVSRYSTQDRVEAWTALGEKLIKHTLEVTSLPEGGVSALNTCITYIGENK